MSRRKFIKQSLLSGFGLASLNLIPFSSFAANESAQDNNALTAVEKVEVEKNQDAIIEEE